jgi:hypothetical protein
MTRPINIRDYELISIRRYPRAGRQLIARDEIYLGPGGDYVLRQTIEDPEDAVELKPLSLAEAEAWFHAARPRSARPSTTRCDIIAFPSRARA